MRYIICAICWGVVALLVSPCFASNFPYRDKYPDVNVIELNALKGGYDKGEFVIVDVRAKGEFDTIQIRNAVNIPYGNAHFTRDINRLAKANPNKKIAVYDNGVMCLKSYKAAEDAFFFASVANIYAFDAGISAWAKNYPADTLLFGGVLDDPDKQLISEDRLQEKSLSFQKFKEMATEKNAYVFDIREPVQRNKELPGMKRVYPIPIEKFIGNIINKDRLKDKNLYIFDQVGSKVKWLMYYLVANNYENFYFLDGGATSVLKEQEYRLSLVQ